MKKRLGFTLVELLAVIVILAIILAIAVPSVMGIVDNAKKSAFEDDAKMLLRAVNYKLVQDENYDVGALQKTSSIDTIKSELGIDTSNYGTVSVSLQNSKPYVEVVGSNKWSGLKATGTAISVTVVDLSDGTKPVITMLGSSPVNINVGSSYTDAGATASDDVDGNITSKIVTTTTVNTSVVGSYTVTYNVSDAAGNIATSVVRTVNVVDPTPPVITMLGSSPVTINVGDIYSDAGATASDNIDGDITTNITVASTININTVGSYTVTYNVHDAAGNNAIPVVRTVNVIQPDNTPPVITMLGSSPVNLTLGASYSDAGATASDNVDGNITSRIAVTSTVNPSAVGTYTVTYNVSDTAGNAATPVVRTINVVPDEGTNFIADFGGTGIETLYEAALASDGIVVAGYGTSNDIDMAGIHHGSNVYGDGILIKYGINGNLIWKKTYGGSLADYFYNIAATGDGYVAVGESCSTDGDLVGLNKGGYDAIIVKYDTSGNVVWKKNFGGSYDEHFYGVIPVSDGYITVGYSTSTDRDMLGLSKGSDDAVIVKYDLNGNVVWKKVFGGTGSDRFQNIIYDGSNYLVEGACASSDGDLLGLNRGSDDAILVKYDTSGNVVWKKNFGGTLADGFSSAIFDSNNYYVVGHSASINGDLSGLNKGGNDGIIVKYDLNGNIIWKHNYGGTGNESFNGIAFASGNYILTGYSTSTNGDLTSLNKGGTDGIVVKYDANGNVITKKNVGGSGSDEFNNIIARYNSYIILGDSVSNDNDFAGLNKGSYDAITYKHLVD